METMYGRIKRMTLGEMREFVYWVYSCGNRDGADGLEDSPVACSYFGGYMLIERASEIMPHDHVSDLWDKVN